MRHRKKLTVLAVAAAAAFWAFWPGFAPDLSAPPTLQLTRTESFGSNTGGGNVVGIEPYMVPTDYASADRFKAKLNGYFDAAKAQGWFGPKTIVLLPEHLGIWLVASGSKSRVLDASSLSAATLPLIMRHPLQFLKNYFIFNDQDIVAASLFRTYAKQIADIQALVYGALARDYQVTIVAGSAALMTAGIYDDGLTYGHGPIFNATFVFGPDGKPIEDAVRKIHPIPSETGFTTPWPKDAGQPTFPLGTHRVGVMICADSWFDDAAKPLTDAGADVLLVPAFLEGTAWGAPWRGYLNDVPAGNEWQSDIGHISEGDAWQKYALPARARDLGVHYGMTVFLKGSLWGMTGHGRALIIEDGKLHVGADTKDGAALYNLWLD